MAAVRYLAAWDLRRRWRSAVVLTLLVGCVGAVVLAAAAGARRSASSLDRFIAYSRPADVEVVIAKDDPKGIAALRSRPEVADLAHLRVFADTPTLEFSMKMAAMIDGRLGTEVDRARLIAGRQPDLNAPNEIAISETFAKHRHLSIGGYLNTLSMTRTQLVDVRNGHDPGLPKGPRVALHVVGIVRRPLDVGDLAAAGGVIVETPAFARTYASRIASWGDVLRIRGRHGAADVAAITADVRNIFKQNLGSVADVTRESRSGNDAISVLTTGLWIFAAVSAIASAITLAIVFAREMGQLTLYQEELDALGCTRRQRVAVVVIETIVIAAAGSVLAVVAAALASPLFPIGVARLAEPHLGLHVDGLVLGAGAAAITLLVVVFGSAIALRVTRASWRRPAPARGRLGARIVETARRCGLGPSAVNGVGMAVDPGRGASAVPLRSAYFGAIAGVAGLIALAVFSASLAHLSATPKLYGWAWDFAAPDNTITSVTTVCGTGDAGIGRVAGVRALGGVCYSPVTIDGHPAKGYGFQTIRGTIGPEIVSGIAPKTEDEVALGAATMRALGKHIGETVTVRGATHERLYRIVGQVALAQFLASDEQRIDNGAAFTDKGYAPLYDPTDYNRFVIGDYALGANRAGVDAEINALQDVHPQGSSETIVAANAVIKPTRPPEIDRLRGLDWFPPALSVLLAILALAAVGHAVITVTRRRRKELAVLKTLGFLRAQVRSAIAWQASALGFVGVVAGIPLGLLVGSFAWRTATQSLGIARFTTVPGFSLFVTGLGVLIVVNAIAFFPARRAARALPVRELMAE